MFLREYYSHMRSSWLCWRCQESGKPPSVCVQAEGVNFEAVWSLGDVFDVNKIASNDIAAIGRCYGVEASRQAITREIKTVFGAYGIAVDARHLVRLCCVCVLCVPPFNVSTWRCVLSSEFDC